MKKLLDGKKHNGGNGKGKVVRDGIPRPSRNDMPAKVRLQMLELLNAMLADTFDLQSHAKPAHWNVRGPNFIGLHKLFDDIHEVLESAVDNIAERAMALGGIAHGTVRMAATQTRLKEYPIEAIDGSQHIIAMADRMATLASLTRAAIDDANKAGDAGTGDLFTEMLRDLDKYLWFVEAHLVV